MSDAMVLSPEQIAQFHAQGFLAIDAISTPEEVESLRGIFDRLFFTGIGRERGAQLDLAGTDEGDRPAKLPQILNPVQFAPELAETEFRANALAIARQLIGPEASGWFEHAIMKPPQVGAPTPWHQDEAHRNDPGIDYDQISVWMPLQEARLENGCIQYIPGSHRGPVLAHRSPDNDPRVTALECIDEFARSSAVPCPIPAGGATIHHCRTLHGAGPNVSEIPRRAYILAFRGPGRPSANTTPFPWNAEKRTAAQARRVAWEKRGGVIGQSARRAVSTAARLYGRARCAASKILRG